MSAIEGVGVVQLVNSFIPIVYQGENKRFLTPYPLPTEEAAEKIAGMYARQNRCALNIGLLTMEKPIMSVWKDCGKWYPAKLHPNRVELLQGHGEVDIGGPLEYTKNIANGIAKGAGLIFLPEIGIFLNQD